jgi:hypothetical protein
MVKHASKNYKNSKDSKYVLIFYLASVVEELLLILRFFTKQKFQNISGTKAAIWWQKLAADFPSLHHAILNKNVQK